MAPAKSGARSNRVLDPVERLSEILFGLIMVLTFTGSISVATADRTETRAVLIGAIGCNIAWGIIDAIMYLMACLNERGIEARMLRSLRDANSREDVHRLIGESLPSVVADELSPELLDRVQQRVMSTQDKVRRPRIKADDLRGALAVFVIVVASVLPVILPIVFMRDLSLAMRTSNAVAVIMLAIIGFAYGRASDLSPWWMAASMVLLGSLLVGLTIAMGG